MKKLLAILLSVIMVLSLVACGNKTQDETPSNDDQQQNTETETKTIKVGLICIGDENDQGYTYNFIRGKESATEALAAKGIRLSQLDVVMRLGTTEGIKGFVRNSDVLAIVSVTSVVDELRSGALRIIDIEGLTLSRDFNFVHAEAEPARLVRQFVDFARANR